MIALRYVPFDASPLAIPDADEAHVWSARLDVAEDDATRLAGTLSEDERERAARLVLAVARRRFEVARGFLRAILGRYLGTRPGEVRFDYGPHGKPGLAGGDGVRFSVSHSDDLAVVAVHGGREVGVDVERMRSIGNHLDLARRFFGEAEFRGLAAIPGEAADRAFLRCWTRKEACSKVLGEPLIPMLRRMEVTVDPEEPARLVAIDGDRDAAAGWTLEDFEPAPGYVGALALFRAGAPRP